MTLRIGLMTSKFKLAVGLIMAGSIPVVVLLTSALISLMYLDSNDGFCRVIASTYREYENFQSETFTIILLGSLTSIALQVFMLFLSEKLFCNKVFKHTARALLIVSVIVTSFNSIDTYRQFISEGKLCSFNAYKMY